jgi:hypothetical protein
VHISLSKWKKNKKHPFGPACYKKLEDEISQELQKKEINMDSQQDAKYSGDERAMAVFDAIMMADMLLVAYPHINDIDPELEDKILFIAQNLEESAGRVAKLIRETQKV